MFGLLRGGQGIGKTDQSHWGTKATGVARCKMGGKGEKLKEKAASMGNQEKTKQGGEGGSLAPWVSNQKKAL